MVISRAIKTTIALTAACCCLGIPSAASGEALLSGYGGPGAGSQAILGSVLINGGEGPGGGSGGSATRSAPTAGSSGGVTDAGTGKRTANPGSPRSGGRAAGRSTAPATTHSSDAVPSAVTQASSSEPITRDDAVYGFLILLALACITALTLRLSRTRPDGVEATGSRDPGQNPI